MIIFRQLRLGWIFYVYERLMATYHYVYLIRVCEMRLIVDTLVSSGDENLTTDEYIFHSHITLFISITRGSLEACLLG